MTTQRTAALKSAAATGKLLLAVCDRRCANCKRQLPTLEGKELAATLKKLGIAYALLTPAEAGDTSLQTGARNMSGKSFNGWPLLNTFTVYAGAVGKKVGNALSMSDNPARVVAVAEVAAWVKVRFGM